MLSCKYELNDFLNNSHSRHRIKVVGQGRDRVMTL